jgi:UDP-N-acetylglucosamine diphosphorylase / glucose-1-phosphate thymidylyltransferase / UDP-N-acetylgalactosamine diphosphorylase / glucosamine-1-phosphate N-acetyltransferase / galactosamine-1-phosphate N-acetyltransferase
MTMAADQLPRDAVILAAGRGTRMKSLTEGVPKPMLPVAGRPLLEWVVEALREAGITRLLIVTGYRAERVEAHFGDGSSFGFAIRYRRQDLQDGTARALLLGREAVNGRPFLLAWGDILTERVNYPRILRTFADSGCDVLLGVNWVEDPSRGAAVDVDEHWAIRRIVEKPPPGTAGTHWHNAGIAVFRPLVFEYAERVPRSPRGEYEIPDAIAAMIADGRDVRAFPLEGFWSDVGTPEDLARAQALLAGR